MAMTDPTLPPGAATPSSGERTPVGPAADTAESVASISAGTVQTQPDSVFTPPSITLPKGGGAIRSIGEKFTANPVTGTGSFTIPIATSAGRSGFGPTLTLSYDSGQGNGPFGLGWSLQSPAIIRRTDKTLPLYQDADESDVFILSGAEDLVPILDDTHNCARLDLGANYAPGFCVDRYRPRIEGLFARIERWTDTADGTVHWRSITRDNITTRYGATRDSRIADPADPSRVFAWLICETYDDRGNAIVYDYKAENTDNVDTAAPHEANRSTQARTATRFPKRIRYGNRTPHTPGEDLPARTDWMFEVVFDYGEHHPTTPTPREDQPWLCRRDPFSTYKPEFELRTYRLCQRILMFHHFPAEPDVGADCLVCSADFTYGGTDQHPPDNDGRGATLATVLAAVTHCGYRRDGNGYLSRSMPPVEFDYSPIEFHDDITDVDRDSLAALPAGLATVGTHWVDLDGEGIPGTLIETPGAWSYKANLGNGRFASAQTLPTMPIQRGFGAAGRQLLDLTNTGQLDVVDYAAPAPGYYARTPEGGWESFRPFTTLPNLRWDDPNLRFVDLDGDGHADVLLTDTDAFTWYPSLTVEGFSPAQRSQTGLDDDHGPRLVFVDADQSFQLADMSGDGLTDLVRVRNGEIAYWPNLGHGRFGRKIVMDHSPWFDRDDGFDPKRVQLGDVDGSGTTDLLYLGLGAARIWLNQSGNSYGDPVTIATPVIDNLTHVAVTDLLGKGTACLVWSSALPTDSQRSLRYIDLLNGVKPYLLVGMRNNLGAETHLTYASSTQFYLADKAAERPWVTRLPFPVHVVEHVETVDRISNNRFTTRYAYHHGYFDADEREFRGFGMVEQFDTEHLDTLGNDPNTVASNEDPSHNVPPVWTKTWFHNGAYTAQTAITRRYDDEYYRESDTPGSGLTDPQAEAMLLPDTVLPDTILHEDATRTPFNPSIAEAREAARALKGAMLRRETYALDGSSAQSRPYQVTECNHTIDLLQPIAGNRHAVVTTHSRETLTFDYERALFDTASGPIADPRVTHQVTLDTNGYGDPLRTAAIVYPRRHPDPADGLDAGTRDFLHTKQSQLLVTLTERSYTNPINTPTAYRTPQPAETRTFELVQLQPSGADPAITNLMCWTDLRSQVDAAGDGAHDLPPEDLDHTGAITAAPYRRLLTDTRILYRRDDLTGASPLGHTETHALPYQHYSLIFTPGLLAAYRRSRAGQIENLIPDPAAVLGGEGGYLAGDTLTAQGLFPAGDWSGWWWAPSGVLGYSPNPSDTPAGELAYAEAHFFQPHRFTDPYANTTTVSYDNYDLLVAESRAPLDNRISAGTRTATGAVNGDGFDYRVLAPRLIADPNRNRHAVTYDALGMVAGTAVMGKPEQAQGDTLDGFIADLDDTVIATHLSNPLANPDAILGAATTRFVYDLHAYRRSRTDTHPQPVVACTLAREIHASDLMPGQQTPIRHAFAYTDGFGRQLQHKTQAEPGPVPHRDDTGAIILDTNGQPVLTDHDVTARWVGTGWTVYDNKTNPVRKYEPFFTDTHRYEPDTRVGVSLILFYDPMDRAVVTLHPDHTYDKVVFDPWRHRSYDANDTVAPRDSETGDPRTDPDSASYVAGYFAAIGSWQTWYQQRINDPTRPYEQQAAKKAAAHADTPTAVYLDNLGRIVLTLSHNRVVATGHALDGTENFVATRLNLDIQGRQRSMCDAGRNSTDPDGRIITAYQYDTGQTVAHQSSMEAGERWILNDVTGKPIRIWDSRGLQRRITYDQPRRPVGLYVDEGGGERLAEKTVYGETQGDTGNHRTRVYQLFDAAGVVTATSYDFKGNTGLSRRQLLTDYQHPVDWLQQPALDADTFAADTTYDALNRPVTITTPDSSVYRPTYNDAGLLETVSVSLRGDQNNTPYVTNIDYNAKGQRTLIEYGNATQTRYDYDGQTFRLARLRTTRPPGKNGLAPIFTMPTVLQDLTYTYDPTGNVTHLNDAAVATVFHDGQHITPSSDYTYDALYHLIEATGREHTTQTAIDTAPLDGDRGDYPFMGLHANPNDPQALRNYTERYEYDTAGNIDVLRHLGGSTGWTRRYTYQQPSLIQPATASNRLSATSLSNGVVSTETYTYADTSGRDVDGCITGINAMAMAWDFKDQLQQVDLGGGGTAYYVYDASGQRIRKVIHRHNGGRVHPLV